MTKNKIKPDGYAFNNCIILQGKIYSAKISISISLIKDNILIIMII